MPKMNWAKARRESRAAALRTEPSEPGPSSPFRLNYVGQCAKCGRYMPVDTPARLESGRRLVHAHGCGSRSDRKRSSGAKASRKQAKKRGPFKAREAMTCATCQGAIDRGATATRNKKGSVVHHGGCPKKSRRDDLG